ncbi:hypothetical protein AAVH_37088 [Aphelenchoides avenae]|nr:hypothetical protein AAVH_37088 [Aphelenchus avenae]
MHDNRKFAAPALFEYAGFANSLIGTNGTPTDSSLAAGILRVLQYHGFDTVAPHKCGPVYFMRWNIQIRIQGSGSTDGATEERNLSNTRIADASV